VDTARELVWADDLVTVEASQECCVPGYLVLRLRPPGASLPGLDPAAAARVGAALAAAAGAIKKAVAAERVYLLSFCEVEPQLHFHLFPRTRWLLAAYRAATGGGEGAPSGPALFEWARRAYPPGMDLPTSITRAGVVAAGIRAALGAERTPTS
jgi:diadenosine tetraphosphate (Ap4A) HIT family hydrolase